MRNRNQVVLPLNLEIRYNIFRKLKKEQKDRHVHKTLVE